MSHMSFFPTSEVRGFLKHPARTPRTDPNKMDFRLQCRDFCDRFEDAFQFSPQGDLLCNKENCAAAEELTHRPQVRFLIELVTGVSIDQFESIEGEGKVAEAYNNKKLAQCYGVLHTFYLRMCQADKRKVVL